MENIGIFLPSSGNSPKLESIARGPGPSLKKPEPKREKLILNLEIKMKNLFVAMIALVSVSAFANDAAHSAAPAEAAAHADAHAAAPAAKKAKKAKKAKAEKEAAPAAEEAKKDEHAAPAAH